VAGTAGVLALVGGPRGRRAAATGVAAIAVTSFVVNQPLKLAGARRRPDRQQLGVPEGRWVRMPGSTSFPSGHSASAAAFAVAVGDVLPTLRAPPRVAASIVAFSRVYTGVHYPGDVLVGMAAGGLLGAPQRDSHDEFVPHRDPVLRLRAEELGRGESSPSWCS
jgi:membrane-associated phospholipid phosphatase